MPLKDINPELPTRLQLCRHSLNSVHSKIHLSLYTCTYIRIIQLYRQLLQLHHGFRFMCMYIAIYIYVCICSYTQAFVDDTMSHYQVFMLHAVTSICFIHSQLDELANKGALKYHYSYKITNQLDVQVRAVRTYVCVYMSA